MVFTKMHGAGNDYVYVDCTKDGMSIRMPLHRKAIPCMNERTSKVFSVVMHSCMGIPNTRLQNWESAEIL